MRVVHTLALVCASLALVNTAGAQDQTAAKKSAPAAKPAAKPNPVIAGAMQPLAPADQEQLLAASLTLIGPYDCEFKQSLSITKHQMDGYVVVTFSSKAYTMKPVRSSTGAVRLEEVGGGPMLMVQIPTKSMLMDAVRGRRIVDACVHETQAREVVTDNNSLGMRLDGQVSTADTVSTPKR